MTDFYQYQGLLFHPREMFAHMGASNPAAFRVFAKFIDKFTFDNDYFFAAPVGVWLKDFVGWPKNQRGAFCAMAVQ